MLLTDNLSPEAANWPAHFLYSRVVVRNSQRAGARLRRVSVAALPPVVNALSRKKRGDDAMPGRVFLLLRIESNHAENSAEKCENNQI